jgi:hypothetical protein
VAATVGPALAFPGRWHSVRAHAGTQAVARSGDVDPAELQLEILAVLEERLGPQTRRLMHKMQFGNLCSSTPAAHGSCWRKSWRGSRPPVRYLRRQRSGGLTPPSPPAEKTTAHQDQAGQSRSDNRTWYRYRD